MTKIRAAEAVGLRSLVLLVLAVSAGCASVPPARGTSDINQLVTARGAPAPLWPAAGPRADEESARLGELLKEPLTVERAVRVAFLRNPQIREAYAELGFAQADVLEASRLSNPVIGYVSLRAVDGPSSQITRSVALSFADVLLLPARARLARQAFERTRDSAGAALINLQREVETAWYEYAGAQQVAQMREAVARTTDSSAEFAQRLQSAGNIRPRNLALELAAASSARVAAARAAAEALRARTSLANLLGISSRDPWQVPARLPEPLATPQFDRAGLDTSFVDQALLTRLDVAAARRDVDLLEDALGVTRRWRWLGEANVGYERESETDGSSIRGPSFSLEVPLFNQNQGGVLRAQSQLEASRARLASVELGVRNELALNIDRLATARDIAERYRTALVPQREAVVNRTLEEFNYMLTDAFELLQAKREQFDAYQDYLEAVRDYWVARSDLRRASGGQLPGDEHDAEPTLGVDAIVPPTSPDGEAR